MATTESLFDTPTLVGQYRVYRSPHESTVFLADRAEYTRFGNLSWFATDSADPLAQAAITGYRSAWAYIQNTRSAGSPVNAGLYTLGQYLQFNANLTAKMARLSSDYSEDSINSCAEFSITQLNSIVRQHPRESLPALMHLGLERNEADFGSSLLRQIEIQQLIGLCARGIGRMPGVLIDFKHGIGPATQNPNNYGWMIGDMLIEQRPDIFANLTSLTPSVAEYLIRFLDREAKQANGTLQFNFLGYPSGAEPATIRTQLMHLTPDGNHNANSSVAETVERMQAMIAEGAPHLAEEEAESLGVLVHIKLNAMRIGLGQPAVDAITEWIKPELFINDQICIRFLASVAKQLDRHLQNKATLDGAEYDALKANIAFTQAGVARVIGHDPELLKSNTIFMQQPFTKHPVNIRGAIIRLGYDAHHDCGESMAMVLAELPYSGRDILHQLESAGVRHFVNEAATITIAQLVNEGSITKEQLLNNLRPKAQNDMDAEEHERQYSFTLRSTSRTGEGDDSDSNEFETVTEIDVYDTQETAKVIRERGIYEGVDYVAYQEGAEDQLLALFRSVTPDENRAFFEQGTETFYTLVLESIDGHPLTQEAIEQFAEDFGLTYTQQNFPAVRSTSTPRLG